MYRNLNTSKKIILANIIIFALLYISSALGNTFLPNGMNGISNLLEFTPRDAFVYPWTFISYFWIHYDIVHIACNMVILYFYSKLFLEYYQDRYFTKIYVYAGVIMAFIYLLVCYTMYVFFDAIIFFKPIIGSSSSVLFILSLSTFLDCKRKINVYNGLKINILLLSSIIFICFVLFDIENVGGHILHTISIISGCIYARFEIVRKNKILDETKEYNKLLEKIRYSGFSSLNEDEKRLLGKYSNNVFK